MNRHVHVVGLVSAALLAALSGAGCSVAPGAAGDGESETTSQSTQQALSTLTPLANVPASAIAPSTGNLYYTSNSSTGATIYREAKNGQGGATVLYSESSAGGAVQFGGISWALVNGNYYAYFSANYPNAGGAGVSFIKRVPLTGGSAFTVATSPMYIGFAPDGSARDVLNDGTNVYWADTGGIRSTPIGGGSAVNTLSTSTSDTHIALDSTYVYNNVGDYVVREPKSGGALTVVATGFSPITALYVDPSTDYIYYGEQNGAVRRVANGTTFTYHASMLGYTVMNVVWDGTHVVWNQCTAPTGGLCNLFAYMPNGTTLSVDTTSAGLPDGPVTGDTSAIYFSVPNGLWKYTY
jgi:hypothetical protein